MDERLSKSILGELYLIEDCSAYGIKTDLFITPQLYSEKVNEFKKLFPGENRTLREFGDQNLESFLKKAWKGRKMPELMQKQIQSGDACLISCHRTYDSDGHWITLIGTEERSEKVANLVDEAHRLSYSTVILECCNGRLHTLQPKSAKVIFPMGNFGGVDKDGELYKWEMVMKP